jgi:hypothetical protein
MATQGKISKTHLLQVIMDKMRMCKLFLFISDEYGSLCEFPFPCSVVSVTWVVLASSLTDFYGNSMSRLLLWLIVVPTDIVETCMFEFTIRM